jgi:predicted phosphodiesterase
MKIAVLSDPHANYPGLLAVADHIERWQPDVVVVAGDSVNRGPRPAECWQFIQNMQRERGWMTVLGNHEEYVISQSKPDMPRSGPRFEMMRSSFWTYEKLGCDVSALEAMPRVIELTSPDETTVRITHGSMLGTRDGVYVTTPDGDLRDKIGQPMPGLFIVGHTHQPLVRSLNGTLVVNAGSAGLPFDGDWRLSYAQLTWAHGVWRAQIVRLDYDRAQAEQDFAESGFLDEGGALTRLMLRELQIASGQIYSWLKEFEAPVLNGELTIEQSVNLFLQRQEPG